MYKHLSLNKNVIVVGMEDTIHVYQNWRVHEPQTNKVYG